MKNPYERIVSTIALIIAILTLIFHIKSVAIQTPKYEISSTCEDSEFVDSINQNSFVIFREHIMIENTGSRDFTIVGLKKIKKQNYATLFLSNGKEHKIQYKLLFHDRNDTKSQIPSSDINSKKSSAREFEYIDRKIQTGEYYVFNIDILINKNDLEVIGKKYLSIMIGLKLTNFKDYVINTKYYYSITNSRIISKILEEYYVPYQAVTAFRSSDKDDSPITKAIKLYFAGNYSEAEKIFSNHIDNNNSDLEEFYLAMCYIETKNFYESIKILNSIIESEKGYVFNQHAQWYLALMYLKVGESKNAKEILLNISKTENMYTRDAKKILKKLDD